MDGYTGYPPPGQYPPAPVQADYGMQRPPSQSNTQPPHQTGNYTKFSSTFLK